MGPYRSMLNAAGIMHPDLVHGIWQVPIHKGRAITQGSGLAYQQRDIMPGLKVTDITGKVTFVLGDHILTCNHFDATGIGPQRDMVSSKTGRNAVAVAVILNQASRAHPNGLLNIAIKRAAERAQFSLFCSKDSINCLILSLWMGA